MSDLSDRVHRIVDAAPVVDMHTHLFAPEFGALNLWGIDELLTYHYLLSEFFRSSDITYEDFWALSKTAQADVIWKTLFVENTPISEAACGVVGCLSALGIDPAARDLREARAFFAAQRADDHLDRVMELAGVTDIVMTNDPFDAAEAAVWKSVACGGSYDSRFHAALRIDPILNQLTDSVSKLAQQGFRVAADLTGNSISELRRFLNFWIERMQPLYMAASMPPDFTYPMETPQNSLEGDFDCTPEHARHRVLTEAVLPVCREHNIPFSMMIGVRRQINSALRLAGDGIGTADVANLERMCADFPENRFIATYLSRENQHALVVAARKFRNLLPFGCWWFVNNPSIIDEITRERLEMLGTAFVPQHSDARVLDQIIYKWRHSRRLIADALTTSYAQLALDGRAVTDAEIQRDVTRLFSGEFRRWTNLESKTPASLAPAGV